MFTIDHHVGNAINRSIPTTITIPIPMIYKARPSFSPDNVQSLVLEVSKVGLAREVSMVQSKRHMSEDR